MLLAQGVDGSVSEAGCCTFGHCTWTVAVRDTSVVFVKVSGKRKFALLL
jgi:hypothetical protein